MSQNPTQTSLFGPSSGAERPQAELIPVGTLSFGVVALSDKGMGNSQETGGEYANLVITLYGNKEFEKRKIYYRLPNPLDTRNSDAWRAMGLSAITRMLEANGFFNYTDPASYQKLNYEGVTFEDMLEQILGTDIAIEVGIDKGTNGRADQNSPRNWLTPSTDKASARGKGLWDLLISGVTTSVNPKAGPPTGKPVPGQPAAKKLGPAALAAQALKSGGGSQAGSLAALGAAAQGLRAPAAVAAGLQRPGMFGLKPPAPVTPPAGDHTPSLNDAAAVAAEVAKVDTPHYTGGEHTGDS